MSIRAVPSLIMLTNKCYFLSKKNKKKKTKKKLNIQKMKITASGPITSWQIDGGENGSSNRLYFLGLQNHCGQ